MKSYVLFLLGFTALGCSQNWFFTPSSEKTTRKYSSTAITLTDLSMKVSAYYQSNDLAVPKDFDAERFFSILRKIYPDQARVKYIQNNYRVSGRALDGGFSVMLCDPKGDQKIMEDLSCHLDQVEIRSWQKNIFSPCAFANDWKSYCD